ncbi:hypothetical protein D3C72_1207260 [compost metagenome]
MRQDAHLIEAHHETRVARHSDEGRHELEVVVNALVINDGPHTKVLPGFGLGDILATQPPQGGGHQHVVLAMEALEILADDDGEVIATHQLLQWLESIVDGTKDLLVTSAGRPNFVVDVGDPTLHHARQCAPVRLGAGRKVTH